jgi:hypothetical protein
MFLDSEVSELCWILEEASRRQDERSMLTPEQAGRGERTHCQSLPRIHNSFLRVPTSVEAEDFEL